MDPEVCLVRARDALNDSDTAGCYDALADYLDWRNRGGFEPENGDRRCYDMASEADARLITGR